MSFYGKAFSDFKLVHGDFLQQTHRPEILESTIVFVNNFAFGPEVDQHLKDIFADLTEEEFKKAKEATREAQQA